MCQNILSIKYFNLFRYEEFCAIYIQNWWKKHRDKIQDRQHVPLASINQLNSAQQGPPAVPVQVSRPRRPLTERLAATIIQRCWRRHIVIIL